MERLVYLHLTMNEAAVPSIATVLWTCIFSLARSRTLDSRPRGKKYTHTHRNSGAWRRSDLEVKILELPACQHYFPSILNGRFF